MVERPETTEEPAEDLGPERSVPMRPPLMVVGAHLLTAREPAGVRRRRQLVSRLSLFGFVGCLSDGAGVSLVTRKWEEAIITRQAGWQAGWLAGSNYEGHADRRILRRPS